MKVELIDTKYGKMVVLPTDKYVGRSLIEYGEYYEGEVDLFRQLINSHSYVLEVGAHFGSLAVPYAILCKQLVCIEPQPVLAELTHVNLMLGGHQGKAQVFNMALGDEKKTILIPDYDYSQENNFGGIELKENTVGRRVEMSTMDAFLSSIGFRPSFIKLDVEGYEERVLKGGTEYIKRYKPVLYVENDRPGKAISLWRYLTDELQYNCYWHISSLFNEKNFNKNPTNIFGNIYSLNMVCFPKTTEVITELEQVNEENIIAKFPVPEDVKA